MVNAAEDLPPIVALARAGDAQAWEMLLQRYRLPLYTYIFQMVRNEHTSLDLVQETLISAVRHIGTLREDSKFPSWLFGIAHQKCIQSWRRQNREEDLLKDLEETPLEQHEDPRKTLIRKEHEADFLRLLDELPPQQRSVLLLYFIEDFSIKQIGEITGVSPGTVKSRLHYAKKAFQELWEEKVS